MQSVWNILAPVNLKEDSGLAVQHAIDVANATHGNLVLLYVDDGSPKGSRDADWPIEAMATTDGSLEIRRVVLSGNPADTIRRYADAIDADMIVMTSGSRRWTRLWKRSVTADVLESSQRPVQVASLRHMDTDYRFRYGKIACILALDGTDDPVIECATALAARTGAGIGIVHVLPDATEGLLLWGTPAFDRPLSKEVAIERIRSLSDRLPGSYTTAIMTGALHSNIPAAAKKMGADAIVAARGILTKAAACPMLSVPMTEVIGETQTLRQYRATGEKVYATSKSE